MIGNSTMSNRNKSILAALFASTLWSTGGIFVKLIDWNPVALAGVRSLLAAMVLVAYSKKPTITKSKPQILGAISYAATVLSFVIANKLTTSANAILLQYTSPIFVAILGFFILKEKVKWYDLLAILFVFLGMGLFFVNELDSGNIIGNLLAIFCGFSLAGTTIALKMEQDSSPFGITVYGNLIAFIVSIPFILTDLPSLRSLIIVIVMGIIQLGIPFIFYINSMRHITALEAILVTVMEPLLNPVWVFIFAGEKPGIYAIFGGIVVITSVTVRSIYVAKKVIPDENQW